MLYQLFHHFIYIKGCFLLRLIPLIMEGLFQLCAAALSVYICWKIAPKSSNIHFSLQNVILLPFFFFGLITKMF